MIPRAVLACVLVLFVAGCSASPSAQSCVSDAECGEGNSCVGGTCAGNAPPKATFNAPVGATTNRFVSLVSDSYDPEGGPVDLRWSVRALVGGCAPDVESGIGSRVDVIFWCPGTYEAAVVPMDELGAEGETAGAAFEVTEATGAPVVVTGNAISATHVCDVAIPACQVVGPDGTSALALAATAGLGSADLAYEWTAIPPEAAAADPGLQPSFAPDNLVAAPTASIANTGGPIAGVYRFRVRVQDSQGLVGRAFQDVVVANSAPVAAPPALTLAHAYSDGLFVAEGDVEIGTDADGDHLFAEAALSPATPDGCTEAITPGASGRVHVRIACSVAEALRGASVRTLSGTVADANGASASFTTSFAVTNRPPTLTLATAYADGVLAVDHGVEPCTLITGDLCYVAAGEDPFFASDPDGDPLDAMQLGASCTAPYSRGSATAEGPTHLFRFETLVGVPLAFRSASGGTGFTVSASVADVFGAKASLSLPLTVRNKSPIVVEAVPAVSVGHTYDAPARRYRASANAARFEDPDGDPLAPTIGGASCCTSVALDAAGRAVVQCERAWDYTLGGTPPLAEFLRPSSITVIASDGWAAVSSNTGVTVLDRPGSITAPMDSVEHCGCVSSTPCWEYAASWTGVPVPVELIDPDGDPHRIVAQPADTNLAQPVPVTCVPGWCYPTVNANPDYVANGSVYAEAGQSVDRVSGTFWIIPTCSVEGRCCR